MEIKRIDIGCMMNYVFERKKKILLGGIVVIMLLMSINIMSYGFNYPIIDMFGFRQAQTAITSYWFVQEGYKFNYITPVLGPPWSVPFEFPIYQYIVALIHEVSGLGLDQAGRLVSIVSFYISALMIFCVLRNLKFSTIQSLVPVIFFLGSPFYLFWSRSFMIESTALAFGLAAILFFIKSIYEQRSNFIIIATVFGVLSALTKVTTFGVCLSFMGLIFLMLFFGRYKNDIEISYSKLLLFGAIASLIPVIVAISWNHHADFLKSQNSLATFLISGNLSSWNFGTVEKKLALKTWLAVLTRSELIIGAAGFIIIGLISLISRKTLVISLAAFMSFLIGPIVFTNLYVVHEYYFYANGIFLVLFVSGGVMALLERRYIYTSLSVVLFVLATMQYTYYTSYPQWIKNAPHSSYVKTGLAIKELTKESDVIIIYGSDWDSSIPYYAGRKAIMDRSMYEIERDEIQKPLGTIGKQNVGSVVLCEYKKNMVYSEMFRQSRVEYFSLNINPVRVGRCDIYHRNITK